jgi:hypothetical protein
MGNLQETIAKLPKPITPQDLYLFLYLATGENVPHKAVCRDHQTPWDLIVKAFFNKSSSILGIGNRKGSKTRSVAKLILAELKYVDGVEIASVGAIEKQANKCYRYVDAFLKRACPNDVVKAIRSETRLLNNSSYEQLVGTVTGVNSPHPHKLRADEVELMKQEVLEELLLVPNSDDAHGIPRNTILTSTRKYTYGIVQSIVDDKDGDFEVLIWCYKEVAEPCKESRRGSGKRKYIIKDYYNVDDTGAPAEKEIIAWSNCGKCPLLPSCRGDLAYAEGYLPIDDLIKDFKSVHINTWIQQMECRRVSTVGKVYPQFDEAVHCKNFGYQSSLPMDISVDFGHQNPNCVGFWQENEETGELFMLDEIYEAGLSTDRLAEKIKRKLDQWGLTPDDLRYGIGDSAQAQQIEDLKGYGVYLEPVNKGSVPAGLDKVRRYLSSLAHGVRLYIHRNNCPNTIREFKNYHYKRVSLAGVVTEEPVKKDDHAMDQVRYYVTYIDSMSNPGLTIID